MWENAVITDAGSALLGRWSGGGTMEITGASAGGGLTDAVALAKLTALADEKAALDITGMVNTANGTKYAVQIRAAENAYTAHQIGIWGRLDGGERTLIAVYQDNAGIAVPAETEMPDFLYAFYATIQLSGGGEMTVVMNPDALMTRAGTEELIESALAGYTAATLNPAVARLEQTLDEHGHSYNDLSDRPVVDTKVTTGGANAVTGAAVAAYVTAAIGAIADYDEVAF